MVPMWLLGLLILCAVAGLVAAALLVLLLIGLGSLTRNVPPAAFVLDLGDEDDGLLTERRWP